MITAIETTEQQKFYEYLKSQFMQAGESIKDAIDALINTGLITDIVQVEMMKDVGNFLQHQIDLKAKIVKAGPGIVDTPRPLWTDGQGKRWELVKQSLQKMNFNAVDIQEIDDSTTAILNEGFEPPRKKKFVVRRGLILGYVQSGKTTNFISLIAKSADSGYKFIIVLTGITDNLRVQTQIRIDERLILDPTQWIQLTTQESDFRASEINAAAFFTAAQTGNLAVIAVVKKNSKRLQSLIDWLNTLDHSIRSTLPILVVDDEADQATPNTAKKGKSAINRLVEKLADPEFMPRNVYMAYTATPFANLLMDGTEEKSLYPRDLVYPISPGAGYFGAAELFGRDAVDENGTEVTPEVNVLRLVSEEEVEKVRHNTWSYEIELANPDSALINALLWFILATAVRVYREGRRDFSSMMIHTSSKTDDHTHMKKALDGYFEALKNPQRFALEISPRLKRLWLAEVNSPEIEFTGLIPEWQEIELACAQIASSIEVKVDNHKSSDRIFYSDKENFPRTPKIVIGGNTLSRGLTLEGLVSSYFLRASGQCDSVLQLGRWFGYRRGYEDLQRIYMPNYRPIEFMEWFRSLALLEADLREQIESMRQDNITPGQLPVRIRNHPYLSLTSAAKSRLAVAAQISFSNQRKDTTIYPMDRASLEDNLKNAKFFVSQIKNDYETERQSTFNGYPVFYNIPSRLIIEFLKRHNFVPDAKEISHRAWNDYIAKANSLNELDLWNIFIASPKQGKIAGSVDLVDGVRISKVSRAGRKHAEHLRTGTLSNRTDILSDLKSGELSAQDLDALRDKHVTDHELFAIRSRGLAKTGKEVPGLMGIYLIDKDSTPKNWDPSSQLSGIARLQPLNAPVDVIGISMFFPRTSELTLAVNYTAVDSSRIGVFDDDEDIDQLIEEAENEDSGE